MKKNVLFYVCALLLLMVGAASCSSDDVDENIVQEATATEELKAFFNDDFATNYSMIDVKRHYEGLPELNLCTGFFTLDEWDLNPVVIRSINSREEFEHTYCGVLQLPDIDFSKYTLIVGVTKGMSGAERLGAVRLVDTGSDYELQVIINRNINPYLAYNLAITRYPFWKIYPKFPTSRMKTNRIIKEVYEEESVPTD